MKRSEKEQIVAEVSEVLQKANGMYLTDFTGLTVEQVTELRREFRKSGVQYKVAKNTLIRRALEGLAGAEELSDKLVGPTGVAVSFTDPVAPAKIIKKFAEKHSRLGLKAAVIERRVYDGSRLDELSKLPTKAETLASILGSIQSPLAAVPVVLNAVIRDLVSVIGEIEKKKAA
jgi:large subunit ribosomal protein L10